MSKPLHDAVDAVTALQPGILTSTLMAAFCTIERQEKIAHMDSAIAATKELTTRLEASRDIFAASPIEETTA